MGGRFLRSRAAMGTAFLAACALAQPAALARGFVGGGLGYSQAEFGLTRDVRVESVSTDVGDAGWKIFGGFGTKYVGLEAALIRFGRMQGAVEQDTAVVSLDASIRGWELMVYGRAPLGRSFAVYGKLGALNWDSDKTTTSVFNTALGGRQETVLEESPRGTNLAWGLGAEFRVLAQFSVRVEFEDFGAAGGASHLQMGSVGFVWEIGGGKAAGVP